jgi:hypothetical protein
MDFKKSLAFLDITKDLKNRREFSDIIKPYHYPLYKRKDYQMEILLIILIIATIGMFALNTWFKG